MPTLEQISLHSAPAVRPETSLEEAVQILRESEIPMVALVDNEQYMGVLTEAALKDSSLIPPGADRSLLMVGPYIHPAAVTAQLTSDAGEILSAMERRGVSFAPVVANRIFKGVVTRADLERALGRPDRI